ncbi:MAG: hypothetical protein JWO82_2876 [Akkermansiaceae bacterium]|nr:hypothetical protein [Akkermansiaceae bacterium]
MASPTTPESRPPLKWPNHLAAGCGVLVMLLALVVLVGWHLHSAPLVRIHTGMLPLHYLTALCLLLFGSGLTAFAFQRARWLTLATGIVGGATGWAVVCQYIFHVDLGISALASHFPSIPELPPLTPSPPTAVCFALCGISMVVLVLRLPLAARRPGIWIPASLSLALCAMVFCGYATGLSGTYMWGNAIGMALHTACGVTLLSTGLLVTLVFGGQRLSEDRWLPVPVALATVVATLVLWQALVAERHRAMKDEATVVAQSLATDSLVRLDGPFRAMTRMKRRWERRTPMTREEWSADAASYIRDEKIFDAIGRTDASGQMQWTSPEGAAPALDGIDLRHDPRWQSAEALKNAERDGAMALSPAISLNDGRRGFLSCIPLYRDHQFDGFLVGVFRFEDFMKTALDQPTFARYDVTVKDGDQVIYGPEHPSEHSVTEVAPGDFHGHPWRFEVSPKGSVFTGGKLPGFVLLLGLPLAVAMAVAVRGFQQRVWQNREIQANNLRLEQEIAEREEAQRELREALADEETAQALLRAAGRIARLGHWEFELGGIHSEWSDITYEIHELPIGTPVTLEQALDFFHPEDRALMQESIWQSVASHEPFDLELRLITARGRTIWVHSRGEPVLDEAGEVTGLRGVFQDIDERHRAAEILEQKNVQLQEATARAEAHARAKAEFLANMSHEIRTPLNAIIGMSDLLMDGPIEPREREFVETIHSSGDVLLGLINDILDFSKIESGHLGLEEIPVHLRECVESALDLVASPAAKKHLDLMYWIDPAVPDAILGDPTRLRQVLVNLLSNAIKFTNEGEVFVKLAMVPLETEDASPVLRVSVRDSGIGIPADRMDRLFQVFSQVDSSTTRRYGGTGLGLAISHRLIEKMDGRLWAESEEGRGSTFHFEVPAVAAASPGTATAAPRSLAGMRVLIVDDNETNRWILQMQAESWGMVPIAVASGREALEKLRGGEPFQIAILDVMMPEMDGYELAAEIRTRLTPEQMPIIMLTSVGDRNKDLAALGIAGMLTKPVKSGPLLRAVQGLIHSSAVPERILPLAVVPGNVLGDNCPLRILVAEDNPVNQRVTGLLLQRMAYRPVIVANGLEVLESIRLTRYDVILLDIQMPEMDGLEAARRICLLHPLRLDRPWMIALTAHAGEGDREECMAAGMDDYLTKPIRSDNLEIALRHAYEQKPSAPAEA